MPVEVLAGKNISRLRTRKREGRGRERKVVKESDLRIRGTWYQFTKSIGNIDVLYLGL